MKPPPLISVIVLNYNAHNGWPAALIRCGTDHFSAG